MTEIQLKQLGFKFIKRYEHYSFNTKRYIKGCLKVEFTYSEITLVSTDLTIQEVNCKPVTLADMKALTPILGENN